MNHNKHTPSIAIPPNYWLNEIERRDREEHENIMMKYTKCIKVMTFVMTLATIVNVLLFVIKK